MNDLDTRLRHMAREEETPVPKDFDENLTRTLAQLPARKRRRVPRAVLLAACLVLVLTGAVLAAESGVFARFGTPGDLNVEGLFYDGTEYGGTWTYSTDRRLRRFSCRAQFTLIFTSHARRASGSRSRSRDCQASSTAWPTASWASASQGVRARAARYMSRL